MTTHVIPPPEHVSALTERAEVELMTEGFLILLFCVMDGSLPKDTTFLALFSCI